MYMDMERVQFFNRDVICNKNKYKRIKPQKKKKTKEILLKMKISVIGRQSKPSTRRNKMIGFTYKAGNVQTIYS